MDEVQAGLKIARRNINNLRYADDTTLWQKAEMIRMPSDEKMNILGFKLRRNQRGIERKGGNMLWMA